MPLHRPGISGERSLRGYFPTDRDDLKAEVKLSSRAALGLWIAASVAGWAAVVAVILSLT
jgi:hypothetical protein